MGVLPSLALALKGSKAHGIWAWRARWALFDDPDETARHAFDYAVGKHAYELRVDKERVSAMIIGSGWLRLNERLAEF